MVKVIEGNPKGKGKTIGIVVSRFNEFVTKRLLDGCLEELANCGVSKSNITIIWVPGAYEIPLVALKLAKKKTIHAVICLGSVIKGETLHYDLVAQGAAQGIMQVSLSIRKPVIFEVLATENLQQAYKRSDKNKDNKGRSAALVALEMISLMNKI